jgi:two-component system phosphate regulon response regulator PhoB
VFTTKKILIADDNRQIRMLVCAALYSGGYELLEAEDGEAAIEAAVEKQPDLVLLDVTMPKLDGFEVLHFLRKRPETEDMRIVMLTTSGEKHDLERGRAEGADDYITKPFEPATLRETVQRQLA